MSMRAPILLAVLGALVLCLQLGLPAAAPPTSLTTPDRLSPTRTFDAASIILPPPPIASATPFDRSGESTVQNGVAPSWALVGIAHAGASTTLLIRDDTAATHLVRPGDQIGSWRVGAPVGSRVELIRGPDHLQLSLDGPLASHIRDPS